jgi:hypothetical protein
VTFAEVAGDLGFELVQEDKGGRRRYTRRTQPYLHWWLVEHPDASAELSWELELGAYLKAKGFHVSVQDELSLLLFPSTEARGPATQEWITGEIDAAERVLASVDLAYGT